MLRSWFSMLLAVLTVLSSVTLSSTAQAATESARRRPAAQTLLDRAVGLTLALPDVAVRLGDSFQPGVPDFHLLGSDDAERELEIRDSVGASATELAQELVKQKVRYKRAKRALGWGIAGLILGPLTIVGGVILLVTIIGIVAGLITLIIGVVWTVGALPALIAGAVIKGSARRRIDEIEAKLELKGDLRRPLRGAEPASLFAVHF